MKIYHLPRLRCAMLGLLPFGLLNFDQSVVVLAGPTKQSPRLKPSKPYAIKVPAV